MHASPSRHEDGIGLYAGGKSNADREHDGNQSKTRSPREEEGAFAVPFSPSRGVDDLMRILRRTDQANGSSSQGRRRRQQQRPTTSVYGDLQYRRMHNNDRGPPLKSPSNSRKGHYRGNAFERWLRKVDENSPQKEAPVCSVVPQGKEKPPPYSPVRQSASEPSVGTRKTSSHDGIHDYRPHSNVHPSPSSSPTSHKNKKRNEKPSSANYIDGNNQDDWNPSMRYSHGSSKSTSAFAAEPDSLSWNVQYFNTSKAIGNKDFLLGYDEPNSQDVHGISPRGQTPPEPLIMNNSIDEIRPLDADNRCIVPKSCKYGDWDKYLQAQPPSYFRARTPSPIPSQSSIGVKDDKEARGRETNFFPVSLQTHNHTDPTATENRNTISVENDKDARRGELNSSPISSQASSRPDSTDATHMNVASIEHNMKSRKAETTSSSTVLQTHSRPVSTAATNINTISVETAEEARGENTNSAPVFSQTHSRPDPTIAENLNTQDTKEVGSTEKRSSSPAATLRMSPPTEDYHSPVQLPEPREEQKTPNYAPEMTDAQETGEGSSETAHSSEGLHSFIDGHSMTNNTVHDDASGPQEEGNWDFTEVAKERDMNILGDSSLPGNGAPSLLDSDTAPSVLEPVAEEDSEESHSTPENSSDSEDSDEHSDDEPVALRSVPTPSQGRFARLSKVQLRPTKPNEVSSSILKVSSSSTGYTAAEREEDIRIQQEKNRVNRLARLYSMAAKSGSSLQQKFAMTATAALKKSKNKDLLT